MLLDLTQRIFFLEANTQRLYAEAAYWKRKFTEQWWLAEQRSAAVNIDAVLATVRDVPNRRLDTTALSDDQYYTLLAGLHYYSLMALLEVVAKEELSAEGQAQVEEIKHLLQVNGGADEL